MHATILASMKHGTDRDVHLFSTAGATHENVIYDNPCAPATQYEEEAIQMEENPAYATVTVY